MTRSLVNSLRRHDPEGKNIKVTCAILEKDGRINEVQIDDAKSKKVALRGAVSPKGQKTMISKVEQIDVFTATYYHNVFKEGPYNLIIGHAPLFSSGAVNLKKMQTDVYKGQEVPMVVLVVHELPKTIQGNLKRKKICDWMKGVDVVLSMGKAETSEIQRFVYGKKHAQFYPMYSPEDVNCHRDQEDEEKQCPQITLMVGRREFRYNGINLKLAREAAMGAIQTYQERTKEKGEGLAIDIAVIGEDATDKQHLKTYFCDTKRNKSLFHFYFISSENIKEIRSCISRSSVFILPLNYNCSKFGLEALNAAAAGVPILVSENSGVADFLKEIGEDEHSVVRITLNYDQDVIAWRDKIIETIDNSLDIQHQKETFRNKLLKNTKHLNFISTIVRK